MKQIFIEHYAAGLALAAADKFQAAVAEFDSAIALCPTYAEAWFYRGVALRHLSALEVAYESFAQAAILAPLYRDAQENIAAIGAAIKRADKVLTPWLREPTPSVPARFLRTARRWLKLRDYYQYAHVDKDELSLRQDLTESPRSAECATAMGRVLAAQGRHIEAELFFRYALLLEPWSGEAAARLCVMLEKSGTRLGEIKGIALRAIEAGSTDERLAPAALWNSLAIGDWMDYERLREMAMRSFDRRPDSVSPLMLLHLTSDPKDHQRCSIAYSAAAAPEIEPLRHPVRRDESKPITIGYISADFHDHPVGHLCAELFELHDRKRFKVFGYGTSRDDGSAIARRIRGAFDRFADFSNVPDQAAVQQIVEDKVDILVDLTGNTFNARTKVLAARPAPIQVNYLGYPGTSGLAVIDYAVVDKIVVPHENRQWFDEALVFLPSAYQANDRKRRIGSAPVSRRKCDLPPEGFVFCCLNATRKILPEVFRRWLRILSRVPDSVLWLYAPNPVAAGNLRREAGIAGIDPARLVFAGRLSHEDHLARYKLADLFLDTAPYGAHTTASDALWAGCPVLTKIGELFPGRVGASLLTSVGMPELIVSSWDEYEERAVEIGNDRALADRLREKLKVARNTCALFDTPRYVRQLEWAYEDMWRRYVFGQAPASFEVQMLIDG